jgi:hypothetical protein
VLQPQGVVHFADGDAITLAWDEHRTRQRGGVGWWIVGGVDAEGFGLRAGSCIALLDAPAANRIMRNPWDRAIRLDAHLVLWSAANVLAALCEYLATTPAARAGLADWDRANRLITALTLGKWGPVYGSMEPLMGPKLDVFLTVQRVVNGAARRIDGRRVAGEPAPSVDDLVHAVLRSLPRSVQGSWRAEGSIRQEVEKQWNRDESWPFGLLL